MQVQTVADLTKYIKNLLESDWNLNNVWVRGEISNVKLHSSGHIYLTLKDAQSCIKAVMFRSRAQQLKFRPENGLRIIARGNVAVYERDGQYQLYIDEMQPDGMGALHLAFEQLKKQLEQEGLFKAEYKRAIPVLPNKIGIVTSPTGAAIRDLLTVINRRFPRVHIIVVPVLVQGDQAPPQIAQAIEMLHQIEGLDVIIVGRGGGSLEELWAFNTEEVARAIFASRIPIISAVGHETDFTIADFVADLRAATPSAAGELVVPDHRDLTHRLESMRSRLEQGVYGLLERQRQRLEALCSRPALTRPKDKFYQYQQHLDYLDRQLTVAVQQKAHTEQANLARLAGKLDALSPLATLNRGYSFLSDEAGQIMTSIQQVKVGSQVQAHMGDGHIICDVIKVEGK